MILDIKNRRNNRDVSEVQDSGLSPVRIHIFPKKGNTKVSSKIQKVYVTSIVEGEDLVICDLRLKKLLIWA